MLSATARIRTRKNNTAPTVSTCAQLIDLVNVAIINGNKEDAISTLSQLQDATLKLENQIHAMRN